MKTLVSLLLAVCSITASAQTILFKNFLDNFKQIEKLSKEDFTKELFGLQDNANVLDKEKNSTYLPLKEEACLCDEKDISWQSDGSYIILDKFVLLLIKRHCGAYKDPNANFFKENPVVDYMLITYTHKGKLIDHQSLGREGISFALHIFKDESKKYNKGMLFCASEGYLTDPREIQHSPKLYYKEVEFEYYVDRNGKITSLTLQKHPEMIDQNALLHSPILFRSYEVREHTIEEYIRNKNKGGDNEKAKLRYMTRVVKNTRPLTLTHNEVAKELSNFLKAYMTDNLNKDSLLNKYLTKTARSKLERVALITNSDPLLRMQTYNECMHNTVSFWRRNWYWYDVRMQVSPVSDFMRIPVRICDDTDEVRIRYIVPEWGGTSIGDSLFITENVEVDEHDPDNFVRSFYRKYTNLYIEMTDSMEKELEQMRKRYCTDDFLAYYDAMHKGVIEDYGHDFYDAVIDNYDFDVFWLPSLSVRKSRSLNYWVSYNIRPYSKRSINVVLKEVDGCYKIDRISNNLPLTSKYNFKTI